MVAMRNEGQIFRVPGLQSDESCQARTPKGTTMPWVSVTTHAEHVRGLPLRDWDFTQIGRGELDFRSAKASGDNALIFRLRTRPKASMTKVPSAGWMALVIPLRWNGEFRINGDRAKPGRVHVLCGNHGFTSLGQERDVLTIGLHIATLRRTVADIACVQEEDVRIPEKALDDLAMGGQLLSRFALAMLHGRLSSDSGRGCTALHAGEEKDLYGAVAQSLVRHAVGRLNVVRRPAHALAMVRAAEDAIRTNTTGDIGLADLCRAAGIARTQLHAAFHSVHGVSPMHFLRQWRLTLARERLLDPTSARSVKFVALDLGFSHSGRFASAYHATFGEYPSASLQRAMRLRGERDQS